ncbi:hypothetical protein RHMOL_Rhmol05G0315200 [Rhododendron molle]|uniref:Uncharacterized protein n=1 Tax=Rhododendron molle TaxID=49168 RepID=A0ACC0NW96_RHOML|nr:hypothetical protein RHMOL_Rhmol05G0315200 [Rhododendron molle]
MGQHNLVVVSTPDLSKEVLHTQGFEFGLRRSCSTSSWAKAKTWCSPSIASTGTR